jgi:hypothetical protein
MVITQNKQNTLSHTKVKPFALKLLEGSIGQAVIETYFSHFGYEIYPFGYENHYANVTRFLKRDPLDKTITKVRAMPDLLVFDRENQESYLVEIKASNNTNVSEYWMEKSRFDCYRENWPEAILAIYIISFGEVYCVRISDLKNQKEGVLPNKHDPGYYFDLDYFYNLPYYFRRMDYSRFNDLHNEIQMTLKAFKYTRQK